MNPHLDEQGAPHMHMRTNDLAGVHEHMHRNTHLPFCPLSITSAHPHTHSLRGKRKCLFKG